MPEPILFVLGGLAYFAALWALLRVLTPWDTKELLTRSAVLTVVCNAPLLLGGAVGLVATVIVAVIAMRVLISVYDASFLAAVLPIPAASLAAFGVILALH
jgi:hypothetical protein